MWLRIINYNKCNASFYLPDDLEGYVDAECLSEVFMKALYNEQQWIESSLAPNSLRYWRRGGDGEAVQPDKDRGVGNCLKTPQNPTSQVHALFYGL